MHALAKRGELRAAGGMHVSTKVDHELEALRCRAAIILPAAEDDLFLKVFMALSLTLSMTVF